MSGPEWFFFLFFKYLYFRSLKRFWDCDFLSMSLNFIIGWDNEKWYNKRVLIWRFPLVFMKSYAGNWQINRCSRNWRNQMTEQYRTIGPEIQGFISDRRSFYRTCPTVFRFHWYMQSSVPFTANIVSLNPAWARYTWYNSMW